MIYFYTRYGLTQGGIGKILNEIYSEISEQNKYKILCEKEEFFENYYEEYYRKDEVIYLNHSKKKIIKKMINLKPFKLSARVVDRVINLYNRRRVFLKKILKEEDVLIDFDFVLSNEIDKINVKNKIVWIHNSPKIYSKKKIELLKNYDYIVCICKEMKDQLLKLNKDIEEKILVIYNPINEENVIKKSLDKNELILEKDYTISIMRINFKQKDFLTLIKAFSILKQKKNAINHYILGDGEDKEKLKKIISSYSLEKEVKLLGNLKNPYPILKNAKLMIHSSKFEGFPTVLIESLFLNIPIISSDCETGPKEILDFQNQGYLFKVGDERELASNLEILLSDEKKIMELKTKNIEWAKFFYKENSIKQISNLILKNDN